MEGCARYQAHPSIDRTACTSLPEDEHLDVQNMLKTL